MNLMTYQEAFQVLHRAGFGGLEIDRFYQLRQDYATEEQDQPPLDPKRLQFTRWLITTGRLTDQIPEVETASAVPHVPKWSWRKNLLTHVRGRTAGRDSPSSRSLQTGSCTWYLSKGTGTKDASIQKFLDL
jgi:hypothetical protein